MGAVLRPACGAVGGTLPETLEEEQRGVVSPPRIRIGEARHHYYSSTTTAVYAKCFFKKCSLVLRWNFACPFSIVLLRSP